MNKPKPPTAAQLAFTKSKIARVALITVQLAGLVLLIYWSLQLARQWQYFDAYRYDAVSNHNPLLLPAYRVAIDILALLAGALMLIKSKWALVPYALHFVAYLCFLFSITGYEIKWQYYPLSALLIVLSQIVVLTLLLWLEKKDAFNTWPLR